MPQPDFTELTFGYLTLSELERLYTCRGVFEKPPAFISQNEEADEGHDVAVTLERGRLMLLQFKRSFVLKRRNDHPPMIMLPSLRMYLYAARGYDQHRKLRTKQLAGHEVLYVTSDAFCLQELGDAYESGNLVSRKAACFEPLDIPQPADTEQHWLSFEKGDDWVWMHSEFPEKLGKIKHHLDEKIRELSVRPFEIRDNVKLMKDIVSSSKKYSDLSHTENIAELFRIASFVSNIEFDCRLIAVPANPSAS